jgi:hypothetical protein
MTSRIDQNTRLPGANVRTDNDPLSRLVGQIRGQQPAGTPGRVQQAPAGQTTAPAADPTKANQDLRVQAPPTAPDDVAALRTRLTELETVLADMQRRMEANENTIEQREKKEAEEARKPGFWRGLMEIFEFFMRLMNPFYNMLSACVRVAKIAFKLVTGKKVDWKDELSRLALDLVGCIPGMGWVGAIGNTAMNVWKNESQILGGANELFDDGIKKDSYLRGMIDSGIDVVKDVGSGAGRLLGIGGKDEAEADPTANQNRQPAQPALPARQRASEVAM